jgi:hypothetical protein
LTVLRIVLDWIEKNKNSLLSQMVNHSKKILIPIFLGILVIIAWLWWGKYLPCFLKNHDYLIDNPGIFGDMFGALNTLFTGLAFVGLIYTILQQREQLAIAIDEIEDTRKSQIQQRFENTFFQLLNLLTGVIESLESNFRGHNKKGRATVFKIKLIFHDQGSIQYYF